MEAVTQTLHFSELTLHAMVVFDLLTKVVIFGSLSGDHFGPHLGTISDLIWRPFRTSFWTEN